MAWLTKYLLLLLIMVGLVFSSGYANIKKCNKSAIGIKLVGSNPANGDSKDKTVPNILKTCQTADWTSAQEVYLVSIVQLFPKSIQQFITRDFSIWLQAPVNKPYKPPRG